MLAVLPAYAYEPEKLKGIFSLAMEMEEGSFCNHDTQIMNPNNRDLKNPGNPELRARELMRFGLIY